MNKHTPKPWSVSQTMNDCVTFEGGCGTENLFLQNVDGYYACQNADDASLIAAAPDLLAALEALLPIAATAYGVLTADLDIARAAIAKAKGESA